MFYNGDERKVEKMEIECLHNILLNILNFDEAQRQC